MKNMVKKFTKWLLLIAMIFSDLISPISVLADTVSTPNKGDVGINDTVSGDSVTVTAGSLENDGDVQVTKTVSKTDTEGTYEIKFEVKGKNVTTTTTTAKPSYTVFVLDASKSMDCTAPTSSNGSACKNVTRGNTPWDKAKSAAISFSDNLVKAGTTNNIALVTFNSNGYQRREFTNTAFASSDFGATNQGTNYNAGLTSAYNYLNALSTDIKNNASLNIIFISDGEPNGTDYTSVLSKLKAMNVNIYTFAYNLVSTSSAYGLLKNISTNDTVTSITSDNIDIILETFVDEVKSVTPAGSDATLTDNVGAAFTMTDATGNVYTRKISEITEEGTTFSFNVEIDEDSKDGWYNTNAGFKLVYKDSNGDEKTIESNKNPQVYWEANKYEYTVNYYKDSIDDSNKLGTYTFSAVNGAIIDNVDKTKDMPEGYKFDSINPETLTIDKNKDNVINVLYTKKELTYGVNYYFKDLNGNYVKNDSLSLTNQSAKYGDVVTADSKELTTIPEGFSYDKVVTNSSENNNGSYTINSNDVVVNLYYERNSYAFKVNYYFNGSFKENVPTKNGSALYNSKLNGNDYKLTEEQLNIKNLNKFRFDKFDPENITVGLSENIINLYYISNGNVKVLYLEKGNESNVLATEENITGQVGNAYNTNSKEIYGYTLEETVGNTNGKYTEEDITVKYLYTKNTGSIEKPKTEKTGSETVDSINGKFNYTINATGTIKDYVGKATLTVTDTLPYAIDIDNSTLDNRCLYNDNQTITCTVNYDIDSEYNIDEKFMLELTYIDVDSNSVTNKATSTIKLDKISETTESETETNVNKGTVVVNYKAEDGTVLADSETNTQLAGTSYTTEAKTFYGYTLKETPSNKDGKYVANSTIEVNYVYTKNIGTSEDELVKEGLEVSTDINEPFKYTITYNTEINDYLGEATLVITDILPFDIDLNKSEFSDNCKYSDGKLVCTYTKSNTGITGEVNTNINANKNIKFNIEEEITLYYINVDNANVTNKVESKLTYGDITAENDAETTTEVSQSKIIVNYVTKDGTKLADSITIDGLAGSEYTTEKREFDKYSFIEVIGEVNGKFEAEDKEITYVYDLTPLPPQTGVENISKVSLVAHILGIIFLICLGFKFTKND